MENYWVCSSFEILARERDVLSSWEYETSQGVILLEEPYLGGGSTDRERGKRRETPDGGNVNVNILRVTLNPAKEVKHAG